MSDVVVLGLGNPGAEYAGTRHNLGEASVRAFARRLGVAVSRKRWSSLVGYADLADGRLWLVLPQTYMNESGRAARAARRDLGVEASSFWVVHDELDLPLCRLRVQLGGSAAGNNGVRSLIGSLGTPDFWRFRIGVGKPASSSRGVHHVLGRWSRAEAAVVPAVIDGVADALAMAVERGLERAQEVYNRVGSLGCPDA